MMTKIYVSDDVGDILKLHKHYCEHLRVYKDNHPEVNYDLDIVLGDKEYRLIVVVDEGEDEPKGYR